MFPRLSYLPLLLPRLYDFFAGFLIADASQIDAYSGYFTHETVPLKWHLPLGLLYDIHVFPGLVGDLSPLPFKLVLHFDNAADNANQSLTIITPTPLILHDFFINSVKEADFVRSGTARPIMSLSTADSKLLWSSTQENDGIAWARVYHSLLPTQGQWRNIPLRLYLPSSLPVFLESESQTNPDKPRPVKTAQIKIVQSPVTAVLSASSTSPSVSSRGQSTSQAQTLGTALHSLLPSLFPSRRIPILARPLLHGAQIPLNAHLEDLARCACYADGWLNVVIVLNS